MKAVDQEEFIKNLKNGHEESFTVLYNTYGKKIYTLAYRMIGNKEDAEDITQETFLQVSRHIESFNGTPLNEEVIKTHHNLIDFSAFLQIIVINLFDSSCISF